MSFAALIPSDGAPAVRWSTVSLPRRVEPVAWWLGLSAGAINAGLRELAAEWGTPDLFYVEEPFGGGGKARVHPTSNRMLGVLLAEIGRSLGRVDVQLVNPGQWKAAALGKGGGSATPAQYLRWARGVAGYTGELEDEAAAIGIATAAGVRLLARRAT